jgi:hypothetical protein
MLRDWVSSLIHIGVVSSQCVAQAWYFRLSMTNVTNPDCCYWVMGYIIFRVTLFKLSGTCFNSGFCGESTRPLIQSCGTIAHRTSVYNKSRVFLNENLYLPGLENVAVRMSMNADCHG